MSVIYFKMRKIILIALILISKISFAQYALTMDINANKLLYHQKKDLLFAIVSDLSTNYPNSLVAIDPYKGKVVSSVFLGSIPVDFVFTTDSNYVYVCFDGESSIKKVDINTFKVIQSFNLGLSKYNGAYYGKYLLPYPGNHNAIIVSRKCKGVSPEFAGTALYLNGVKLKNELPDHNGAVNLIPIYNDSLYSFDNNSIVKAKYSLDSGLTQVAKFPVYLNISNGYKMTNNKLYTNYGTIFEIKPFSMNQAGTISFSVAYNYNYVVEPDTVNKKVFYAQIGYFPNTYKKGLQISSFNMNTFTAIQEIFVDSVCPSNYTSPACKNLTRFGKKGLAVVIKETYPSEKSGIIGLYNNASIIDTTFSKNDVNTYKNLYVYDTIYTYKTVTDTVKYNYYVTNYIYDTTHLSVVDTLLIQRITNSINGNIIISDIKAFPNPTKDNLNIEISNYNVIANFTLTLTDINGNTVYSSKLNSNLLKLDITSFPKGLYFITLKDSYTNKLSSKKILIE